LGVKRFFGSVKNGVTLSAVVALLVFVSLLVYVMSYNLNDDRTAMIQMVGLEMSELYVQAAPGADIYEVNGYLISDKENVSRTLLSAGRACAVDGYETYCEAKEDYSSLVVNTLVKGRYPASADEITLGTVDAKAAGKTLNDTVNVEIDGKELSYTVVGITQSIAGGGEGCGLTFGAMLNHNALFKPDTIYVYLKENVNVKDYYNKLKDVYGNKILIADTNEQMDTILSSMGSPLAAKTMIMTAIAMIVIAFVLFLITSALIRKEKKSLGIMKAIGFKNRSLSAQILLSFLPALVLGTAIGIVLGFLLTNPIMSVFFGSAGLLNTYFIVPPLPTALIGIGIWGASVLIMYLISLRLRKITPHKLITEQ
jgi:putative ABC transport system permease protein